MVIATNWSKVLFLFFIKIFLRQIGLTQNRSKSSERYFLAVHRHNYCEDGIANFAIFGMTALLGNKKEALANKDFQKMFEQYWFRHIAI